MPLVTFSCLVALDVTSSTMFKKSGECASLICSPFYKKNFHLFTDVFYISSVFVIYDLYSLKVSPSILHLLKVLFWMLTFVKWFFCIDLDDHMFCKLYFVNAVHHIYWFLHFNDPWISGIDSISLLCMILLDIVEFGLLILGWNFCTYVHWRQPISFFLSGFSVRVMLASYNEFGSALSSF